MGLAVTKTAANTDGTEISSNSSPETAGRARRGTGRRFHGALIHKLGVAILSGEYKPGDTLSGEVAFAEALDVSRSVAPGYIESALKWIRDANRTQSPATTRYVVFAERALQTYSFVYRNASDAQMEEYVRFAESAPARRYHEAGIKAIDSTISQAAVALGQDLGASLREKRNQS